MTTWTDLERHRRLQDPTIPTVSWRCSHHPANPIYFTVHHGRQPARSGRCIDCAAQVRTESIRCTPCSYLAKRLP